MEVCLNRAWGTVCNDQFSEIDAVVVCKQMEFAESGEC